jgi:hypothetical protein
VKGVALFGRELGRRPAGAILGLGLEYAGFFAGCFFALLLLATRLPLGLADRVTGWRLRERCIDAIARLSPG